MSSLTATPDPSNSWTRLDLDFSDVLATHARIVRTNPDGTQVDVRANAFTETLTTVPANPNQTFEGLGAGSVANWFTPNSVNMVADNTQAHGGLWSNKLTPPGVTVTPYVESDPFVCMPTQQIQASAWLFSLVGYATGLTLSVVWYDANGTQITTSPLSAAPAALGASTWTQYGSPVTALFPIAPAGTVKAAVRLTYAGTPAVSVVVWMDDVRAGPYPTPTPLPTVVAQVLVGGKITLYDTEAPLDQAATYTAVAYNNQGPLTSGSQTYDQGLVVGTTVTAQAFLSGLGMLWLKDPTRPANSIQVGLRQPGYPLRTSGPGIASVTNPDAVFQGIDVEKRAGRSTAFDVNNRDKPVAVTRSRSSFSSQLFLITRTFADRDQLRALLKPGGQLLFQVPSVYGMADAYLLVGDEQASRVGQDHRYPVRVFALPYQVVDAPPGPSQGVPGARWSDLCNHAATGGAMMAGTGGLWDTFSRTLASAWGTPDTGGAYTLTGAAAQFSTNGSVGIIVPNATNTVFTATAGSFTDSETYFEMVVPAVATGAAMQSGVVARWTNASNYYQLTMQWNTGGTGTPILIKRVAAVETTLATGTAAPYVAGSRWRGHLSIIGTTIKGSIWSNTGEPAIAQVSATDAALAGPGANGSFVRLLTSNTNVNPSFQFDNILVPAAPTWAQVMARILA